MVDLGVMLAGTTLKRQDLRWIDLSEANLVAADLSFCDLIRVNLARTILFDASLEGANCQGTRFYYGEPETASPGVGPPNLIMKLGLSPGQFWKTAICIKSKI